MRTVSLCIQHPPACKGSLGLGDEGPGVWHRQSSRRRLRAAAAAAFPALWKTPPSCRRLPLTQAASLPDGPRSPQPEPTESPFVRLSKGGPCCRLAPPPENTAPAVPWMGSARECGQGSPWGCLLGREQQPGMLVWVVKGGQGWRSSVLLGGMDGRIEGCSTTGSLISWLFEAGKPSLGNTRAAELARLGWGS